MADRTKFLRRKNFFAAAVITAFLWIGWIVVFFFIPPDGFLIPLAFAFLTFLAVFFTGALLFASSRRGLLVAFGVTIFMILRYFEIGNYLNLILLGGIFLSIEYYLSREK